MCKIVVFYDTLHFRLQNKNKTASRRLSFVVNKRQLYAQNKILKAYLYKTLIFSHNWMNVNINISFSIDIIFIIYMHIYFVLK